MALEGNIETHDIMQAPPEKLAAIVEEAVAAGTKPGRRFILCPSSGYMENPEPTERHIKNLLLYVEEGYRLLEKHAKSA
jgi:uroporphyrinogen-III decarboxylase